MSILPPEIITDILLQLPVKTLVRLQCVSKRWYALINHSFFINNHLKLSIAANRERKLIVLDREVDPPLNFFWVDFNDDDRFGALVNIRQPLRHPRYINHILGYCNGLVCFDNCDGDILIWNPLIRRYKKLPFEPIENPSGLTECESGRPDLSFGHDPDNDDYKVMRVVQFHRNFDDIRAFEIKVYSLRRHCWKKVEEEWPEESRPYSGSVSLNGAFHWLFDTLSGTPDDMGTILAFDLATEKFREFTIPVLPAYEDFNLGLEVLKGCLCVCVNVGVTLNDFWVMKEYGVFSSWARLYTIVQGAVPWTFEYCKPLVYSKDGKKVLMEEVADDDTYHFWYDIEERRGRRVQFRGMPSSFWFETAICMGSLVLLDGDSV